MLNWAALPQLFPDFPDPERWLPLLERHAELLAIAPVRTTAVQRDDAVARNYAESLEAYRLASAPAVGLLVDVGSGGGFPGMVIATVAPGLEVHLIEAHRRRAALLDELAQELGLDQVRVHPERAEEAGRGPLRDSAHLVLARAVAPLSILLEYTAPMTAPRGVIAVIKGSRAHEELAQAAGALCALACEHLETAAMRPVVSKHARVQLFQKLGATPDRYPRRPGMPAKRPVARPARG